jgi:hypothetical protein
VEKAEVKRRVPAHRKTHDMRLPDPQVVEHAPDVLGGAPLRALAW